MMAPHVQTYTWDRTSGATTVALGLTAPLAAKTAYRLTVPSGCIKDRYGNTWQPLPVTFATVGLVGAVASTSASPTTVAQENAIQASEGESGPPGWVFAMVG